MHYILSSKQWAHFVCQLIAVSSYNVLWRRTIIDSAAPFILYFYFYETYKKKFKARKTRKILYKYSIKSQGVWKFMADVRFSRIGVEYAFLSETSGFAYNNNDNNGQTTVNFMSPYASITAKKYTRKWVLFSIAAAAKCTSTHYNWGEPRQLKGENTKYAPYSATSVSNWTKLNWIYPSAAHGPAQCNTDCVRPRKWRSFTSNPTEKRINRKKKWTGCEERWENEERKCGMKKKA